MKFLILFACAIAAAQAGYVAPYATYYGAQHLPIINHEGVPVDTASVQHARAAHLAHKVNVHARNGDYAVAHAVAPVVAHHAVAHHAVAPIVAHTAYSGYYGAHALHYRKRRGLIAPLAYHGVHYAGPQHLPIINHEGVPVDTASVQHARAAHLAHKVNVHARNGDLAIAHHAAPIVSSYAHHAVPVVASTYHAAPFAYAHHGYAGDYAHHY